MTMTLYTHKHINAWLRGQAAEAAGAMTLCAPADIAADDARAQGAFESVVDDAIDGLTKRGVNFDTACEVLGVAAEDGDTPETVRDRLQDALRERLWQETSEELDRIAAQNADNSDKMAMGPRF